MRSNVCRQIVNAPRRAKDNAAALLPTKSASVFWVGGIEMPEASHSTHAPGKRRGCDSVASVLLAFLDALSREKMVVDLDTRQKGYRGDVAHNKAVETLEEERIRETDEAEENDPWPVGGSKGHERPALTSLCGSVLPGIHPQRQTASPFTMIQNQGLRTFLLANSGP